MNEDVLGGVGYAEFFLSLVIVQQMNHCQVMMEMLDYISKLKSDSVVNIAISLVSHLNACLFAGKRHVLPSVALGAVWSTFHRLHSSQDILQPWTAFSPTSQVHIARNNNLPCKFSLTVL